ncbi:hypothetical protein Ddye_011773 [Dipteronia dyeriana]|uniref:DUF4371 domain-containing protein n=1 Tax=Dipteronia dyeriana TaxID=168575 RepID=A0AAD9X392_9ROSI|nr:hypothetical protein Ddye_011773 [Dipteronia dyeriana]
MNTLYIQETLQNRLQLKTSLEAVKWLAMQGCAFRGHDESINSTNRGNFIEMIKLQAKVNQEIVGIVLENSPQNAKYTSPRIQKELLNILANRVRAKIREEIRDAKFCILVDEVVDESNKEQMTIILRYEIDIPNMNAHHMERTKRSCQQKDNITVEHYYHISILIAVIDYQMIELNNRFLEQTIELLTLSTTLSPIDVFKSFDVDDIFILANKLYSKDFSKNDIEDLRRQLSHYRLYVLGCPEF